MTKQDMRFIDGTKEIKEMDDDFFYSQVGPGWKILVKQFIKIVEVHSGIVCQIKEKFGNIRLYALFPNGTNNSSVYDEIHAIENMSNNMCEYCGGLGTVCCNTSWLKNHCDNCKSKHRDCK